MIKEQVRGILVKNFKTKAHLIQRLADHEDFVKKNLFDSYELIKVVLLLEAEFKVTIEVADLANENLNSLDKIECFLKTKKGGK
jgi:acyl carrier protein